MAQLQKQQQEAIDRNKQKNNQPESVGKQHKTKILLLDLTITPKLHEQITN